MEDTGFVELEIKRKDVLAMAQKTELYTVEKVEDGKWKVTSPDGNEYEVGVFEIEEPRFFVYCTCEYFRHRRALCKHIAKVLRESYDISTDRFDVPKGAGSKRENEAIEEEKEVTQKFKPKSDIQSTTVNLYRFFMELLEGQPDLIMIFGESGSCKTKLSLKLIEDAESEGKTALYIDTEGNVQPQMKPKHYEYIPVFEDLVNRIVRLTNQNERYDVVVLDSIGVPVLGAYALASLKQKGDMLLKMQSIAYMLKAYAIRNNSLVVITNQPISELSAMDITDPEERRRAIEERRPFGDKTIYWTKELLRTRLEKSTKSLTVAHLEAWRSRKFGRGKKLLEVHVSDDGVRVMKK